jgi:tetratricopeptide (TPR) repeat protein
MSRFKRLATLALFLPLLCNGASAEEQAATVSNSSLGSELFYQLLVGEISAQNGDASSAYALMLDAARKANSEQLYERAVALALGARSGESALTAAQAWSQAFPASQQANRYVLQILIGLNRISDTVDPLKKELTNTQGPARIATISLLPRYLARATDRKQAASAIEQALTPDLSNKTTGAAAWAAVGTMRLLAGDTDGALNAARRGATFNAQSDEIAMLALNLWDAKVPAAEELVQKYMQGKAQPELRLEYARRLVGAKRMAQAYSQTQQVTRDAPEFAEGWLVLGSLEFQDRQFDTATTSLKKYVALRGSAGGDAAQGTERGVAQAYVLLSQIAEQGQRYDEAMAYLQNIDSPQDALRIQGRKASLLARQGKMTEARALLRDLPEKQPEDARLKVTAEVALLRDYKQFDQAYAVLVEAVKRSPDDVELVYEQAMAAEKIGKTTEMETLLRQVIATKPDYQHAYNALGYSLADRNTRLTEARELINKALELAPNDPFILDSLGWLEFRSGNLPEALRILNDAYKARPDAEIAAHLGEVLWNMNRREDANSLWAEGKAQSPDNETLLETMRRLNKP